MKTTIEAICDTVDATFARYRIGGRVTGGELTLNIKMVYALTCAPGALGTIAKEIRERLQALQVDIRQVPGENALVIDVRDIGGTPDQVKNWQPVAREVWTMPEREPRRPERIIIPDMDIPEGETWIQ